MRPRAGRAAAALLGLVAASVACVVAASVTPWSARSGSAAAQDRARDAQDRPLVLVVDDDDDDEDGVADLAQGAAVPGDELARPPTAARVEAVRGVRLVHNGVPVDGPRPGSSVRLQAIGGPAVLRVHDRAGPREVAIEVVHARWATSQGYLRPSTDAIDVREAHTLEVAIDDPAVTRLVARVVSQDTHGRLRDALEAVALERSSPDQPLRSRPIRFITSEVDHDPPHTLRIRLRDRVRVELRHRGTTLTHDVRVGRPSREAGALAARQAQLRMLIVRAQPGGMPSIGGEPERAVRLAREQLEIASEVWAQCAIDFAPVEITVVDPPAAALLEIAGGTGFPASGGRFAFRAAGRRVELDTVPGASPLDSALALADALRGVGLSATVFARPRETNAAFEGADLLVRQAGRLLASLEPDGPLSTDRQHPLAIGRALVDDGLDTFDDATRPSGTLEERALLLGLIDGDPRTIEVVIVPFFADRERAGEAFLERDRGPLASVVVLDREGVARGRIAWTIAHEIGHVLLDDPLHAEDYGLDEQGWLMDADEADHGGDPRRLSPSDCARARRSALLAPRPELAPGAAIRAGHR